MLFRDLVYAADRGVARLRNRAGAVIAGREWGDEKSVVEVHGWVKMVCRERGKIVPGTARDAHNVWTNTGREYLAQVISLKTLPSTPYRADSVTFIGVGTGSQVEDPGVISLADPVEFDSGEFLARLDVATFPLNPTRTTVRFHRTFLEDQITLVPGVKVLVSELGLFTNGSPDAVPAFTPNTRVTNISVAKQQAPVAYKAVEPVGKSDAMQLEVSWEVRF